MILALALRLFRFEDLSIWMDEGSTIHFARLPWSTVLGLTGAYDTHPPLYYSLVKAAGQFGPEVATARLLSVISGTISVGLIAAIALSLGGPRIAFVAGLAAASAPLLVWYSQEARQYAATSVAVLLAYLALVSYRRRPRLLWAVLYALSLTSALYLDYSAMYPLLPQAALLALLVRERGRDAVPMLAAAGVAALAFVPWLPVLVETAQGLGESRSSFLGLTLENLAQSTGAVIGIRGWGEYFATSAPPAIIPEHAVQIAVGITAVVVIVLVFLSLRRDPFWLAVPACLLLGSIGVGSLLSLVSPGLAPRTVSYATFGWVLLLAVAATESRLPRLSRWATRLIGVGLLLIPLLVLNSIYTGGHKEHWRELARDTSRLADAIDYPVVVHPLFARTLIDTYEPEIHEHKVVVMGDDPDEATLAELARDAPGLIVVIYPGPRTDEVVEVLEGSGLDLLMRREYPYNLGLELWVAPDEEIGLAHSLDLSWGGGSWALPEGSLELASSNSVLLQDSTPGEEAAVSSVSADGGAIHLLRFEARLTDPRGAMRAFVICATAGEPFLEVAPDGGGRSVPADGEWHLISIVAMCPYETNQLRLDVRNAGLGSLALRELELRVLSAP